MDNKDKQALIDGTATIPYKLHILNNDGTIKDTLTEEDIVSTDYEDYRYVDSSSLCIGQFVARKLKGEVKILDKDLQIEDNEISVEMGVNRNDGSKEYALSIDGKSEQETRSGKNLFNNKAVQLATKNGITTSLVNGHLHISGTSTAFVNFYFVSGNEFTIPKGTNTINASVLNSIGTIELFSDNVSIFSKQGSNYTFTLTEDKIVNGITLQIKPDVTIDKDIDLQIEQGSSVTSYELFGASPSPDYPSEIKTVKGIRNLFDKTSGILENRYFASDGSIASTSTINNFLQETYIEVKPNTDYILFGDSNSKYLRICEYDKDKTFIKYNNSGTSNKLQITTLSNTKYIRVSFVGEKALDVIQIEKGKIAHEYVPYGSWLEVKNTGKNLFDKDNEKKNYTLDNNGTIYYVNNRNTSDYIPVKGNTKYTANINITRYACYDSDKTKLVAQVLQNTSFTTPANTKYIRFTYDNSLTNVMLEKGTQATEYEPYKEISTLIDMNKPNLFDKENVSKNVNWFIYKNGKIGYAVDTKNVLVKLPIDGGKTYSIKKEITSRFRIATTNKDISELSTTSTNDVSANKVDDTSDLLTITSSTNDKFLYIFGSYSDSEYEKLINSLIIYEGYSPYYELPSIGDTKDILTIQNGQAYINQKIGKVVLDGSENWQQSGYTNDFIYSVYCDSIPNINHKKPYISDNFKFLSLISSSTNEEYISNSSLDTLRIGVFKSRLESSDLSGFKKWLSNNPVAVYYELAEPNTIELPRINKIESIDNTENISIVTNIPTTFQITEFPLVNWYNLGNFLITKPTDDDVKGTLTFDSMDYTKKFNQTFDSTNIIFPCTVLELAKYCCEQCGVELATIDFINNDFEVIDNQYTEEDTYRKVMQDIGKLAYSWVRIGWDNKCYIDFNYGKEVDEYNKINNDNYYDLELQQKTFGPVNRVIIGMSDVEGENVYIEDEESIAEYGVTELQIYDNNLTYTPELRNKVIDSAKVLFGLTYTPMTLNTTGHPWFLGNEKVEVAGMDNTIYYTYPWDRTITYSGHIKSKLDSKGETKTETEYKYKGDVENVLKKTRIIVNKQEGTITSLTQTTTTIQDNLQQNYYDKTQTNRLIQTSGEGITNTFSEAGGNNIFRNTGLWFEDSSTSYYIYPKSDLYPSNQTFTNGQRAYEFWDGLVLKEYYDKAANLTAMSLQNGYLEQKQQVPNGNYTVSFKYKKLIESATTKVIINNVEYDLTNLEDTDFRTGEQDSDGNYITQPLTVTDGYITVRFYSNVKNAIQIYDLMVNAGTVKLAYSQNQNETTTDTVNISKGITITSSNTDTTFKANSDGIRTLNKSNEVLSEFTDKGMKNKQMEVTDEATIVQVLFQNVGDQTWLTRL